MKKLLLFTTILTTASLANAQFGELENGQFEDWTTTTLFENPDTWQTSNYQGGFEIINATKDTDAQNGSFSCHLETVIQNNDEDTSIGFAIQRIPTTLIIDTLKGWYKSDIQTGDTAIIVVELLLAGNTLDFQLQTVTGTQSAWTPFAIPFNSNLLAGDTIFIGAASSNAFLETGVDGSILQIDNISFASSVVTPPAVPNGDFENWSDIDSENPDGYDTFNDELVSFYAPPNVLKSTDAYEGSFAAELVTLDFDGDTVPGIISNGDVFNGGGGVEYTNIPDSLVGYYKYAPSGTDTGFLSIEFRDNAQTVIDFQGFAFLTNANYTFFSVPFTLSSAPDTMLLTIWSGNNPGSSLKIDSLALTGGNVIVEEVLFSGTKLTAYPNPTTDFVTATFNLVESSALQLQVYDMQGKVVMNENYGSLTAGEQNIQLNVQNLTKGTYFIKLKGDKESIGQKITVQ